MNDYPITMKCCFDDTVVEFTDLQVGTIIVADYELDDEVGDKCSFYVPHTDTFIWEKWDG